MKNLLIVFMLGLFALCAAPIQSMANMANEQQQAVVISQAGDIAPASVLAPEVSPLLDLVTIAPGQMVEYSGIGYNLYAQNELPDPVVDTSAGSATNDEFTIVSDLRDANGDLIKPVEINTTSWADILKSNWAELLIGLLAFLKILVRLTPTIKDDAVFGKIDSLISWIVPNLQKKKSA